MKRCLQFVSLYSDGIQRVHLSKDVVKVVQFVKNAFIQTKFVSFYQDNEVVAISEHIPDVKISFIGKSRGRKVNLIRSVKFIVNESHNIDVLHLFHINMTTIILGFIYKLFRSKGILYIKSDMDSNSHFFNDSFMKIEFFKWFLKKKTDIISSETNSITNLLKENIPQIVNKLIYVPSGADYSVGDKIDEYVDELIDAKENLLITVGRIGSIQKNNELLLDAIKLTDLKDWKVAFIGPIERNFEQKIKKLILTHPEYENRIMLYGNVSNRERLFDIYRRAKIFCLTSRWESFGIVLIEAMLTGSHIITTNIDSASDITCNEKYGRILKDPSPDLLSKYINEAMQIGDSQLTYLAKQQILFAKKNFSWSSATQFLRQRIMELS